MSTIFTTLYQLIQEMSKAERRHFKLTAAVYGDKKKNLSTRLFDAFCALKSNDEKALKTLLKDQEMVKNLSIEKRRLYALLKKTLSSFHYNLSKENQLERELNWIRILYSKSMYDECAKKIKKAKKIATAHSMSIYLLQLDQWQRKLNLSANEKENITTESMEQIQLLQKKLQS